MNTLLEQGAALRASLQAAGSERSAEGWIQQGMARWLRATAPELICLTEYRGTGRVNRESVDYAFIRHDSVGSDRLQLETMFEAKFNYTAIPFYLNSRAHEAARQLLRYLEGRPRAHAYFLYLVADHSGRTGAADDHDRGWKYLRAWQDGRFEAGIVQTFESAMAAGLQLLAEARPDSRQATNLDGWHLHLGLYQFARPALTT